jgi:hypothetical protein
MWIQTYGYDRWGNRTSLVNTGSHAFRLPTQSTPGVDPATNRLNDLYYTYDVAGNLRGWPGSVATYDAENRQSYYGLSAKFQYSYDGDGRRVKKVNLDGGPLVTVSSITPVAR